MLRKDHSVCAVIRWWLLVIAAIRKLKDENKLSPDRARFLPIAEERLAQLEAQASPK
jgi:hypothetical protein